MPYDEKLADRLRRRLVRQVGLTEKRMFGGLAFMLHGNMCCGVVSDRIILRLGKEGAVQALESPHTAPMDFTGRPLGSMIYLEPPGYRSATDLHAWIDQAVAFTSTLPRK